MSAGNFHRTEHGFRSKQVNCCKMKEVLFYESPCVYGRNNTEFITCSPDSQKHGYHNTGLPYLDASKRQSYRDMKPESAKALNLPLIDKVEVINSISSLSAGNHTKNTLRVVVLNIERGRRALTWIDVLKKLDPDLVLLNEADFGMARSDNQHVARNLASMLSMNGSYHNSKKSQAKNP